MNQISYTDKLVLLHIDYEAGKHRIYICHSGTEELENLLELMFGTAMGEEVFKLLKRDGVCVFPIGEYDKWFEEHLHVYKLRAEFDYEFPKKEEPEQEKEDADEIQQE